MEKIPINKDLIKDKIEEEVFKCETELDTEQEIVFQKILDSLPESGDISPRKFSYWCNREVENILSEDLHPKDNVQEIRSGVAKEMRYLYDQDRFEAVSKEIFEQDMSEIGPSWFEKNHRTFHQYICRHFRLSTGDVDWSFVAKKLNIEDRFYKKESEKGLVLEDRVKNVISILEEKNPETFGPRWLRENATTDFSSLKNLVLDKEQKKINWDLFTTLLPPEWSTKWVTFERKNGFSFEQRVEELVKVLENKKPAKISPSWILNNASSEYRYFSLNLGSNKGVVDWEFLLNQLPEKWSDIWHYQENRDLSGQKSITELVELVRDFKVSTFSPKWILQHDPSVYRALKSWLRNNNNNNNILNWELLRDSLPKDIASKFEVLQRNREGFSCVAEEIVNHFGEDETITVNLIRTELPRLYKYLIRNMRNSDNTVNWKFIMRSLQEDYGLNIDDSIDIGYKGKTYKSILKEFNDHLKSFDIQDFDPSKDSNFINLGLQSHLQRSVRTRKALNIDLFLREVDEPYRSIWIKREWGGAEKKRKEISKQVVERYKDQVPESLSAEWIKENKDLYSKIKKTFIKNKEGEIDWHRFVSRLPLSLKKRWEFNTKDGIIDQYRDPDEVSEFLSKHQDELYTLFLKNKDYIDKGEEIWSGLIKLAQSGNADALETTYKYAEQLINDYIAFKNEDSDSENFLYLEIDEEEKGKIINRCIRRYDLNVEGIFVNYLLKSIRFNLEKKGWVRSIDAENRKGSDMHCHLSDDNTV